MKNRGLSLGQATAIRIGRKRKLPEADLDITPMIDVTFLLLIFFMVTSTMSSQKDLDVPKARHGTNVEEGAAIMILVHSPRSLAGEPTIELQGKSASLEEVGEYVKAEVGRGKREVIVKAGREVPHAFVQQVFRAANVVEGLSFSLGVQDKTGS